MLLYRATYGNAMYIGCMHRVLGIQYQKMDGTTKNMSKAKKSGPFSQGDSETFSALIQLECIAYLFPSIRFHCPHYRIKKKSQLQYKYMHQFMTVILFHDGFMQKMQNL